VGVPGVALVLAAGLGMRLRPLTDVRAKPAIPVEGEPLIRRILQWLAANRVGRAVINLHHRPETIARVVGDGGDLGVAVRYSWEQPVVLGSGGGPRQAVPLIDADTFVIVNGDTLTDLRLELLATNHAGSGALATLALVPNLEPARYGGVQLARDGAITGFVPRGAAAQGSYHFIGVQIAQVSAFDSLAPEQPAASIGGLYDRLISARSGSVRGMVCDASFWDVGTVADYWRTSCGLSLNSLGRRDGRVGLRPR
jgi:NDP-sugar pyrophosphorylase family protein